MPRCDECRFRDQGECHRSPPAVQRIGEPTQTPNVCIPTLCGFPRVEDWNWCGEFVRALPADIEARKKPAKQKKSKPTKGKPNVQEQRKAS